jgi:hypothetical protein
MPARALPDPGVGYERRELTLTHGQVESINHRLRQQLDRDGAVRMQVAYFRCPWPCTEVQYLRVRTAAIDRWVGYMERTGWALVSKVGVRPDKHRPAHGLRGDFFSAPLLGEVEIPVAAAFKKLNLVVMRTEVPVSD